MSKNLLALCAAFCFVFSACRSTNHKDEGSPVKAEEGAGAKTGETAPPAAADECANKPEPVICCEALTPSCNECRDNAKKAKAEWAAKCLKPVEQPKDCASPPVSDCSTDSSDSGRQCREAAITALVDWKERCASMEAYPCDKQPPQADCCTQAIPSCNGCRDRNRRLQDDWDRRCK